MVRIRIVNTVGSKVARPVRNALLSRPRFLFFLFDLVKNPPMLSQRPLAG